MWTNLFVNSIHNLVFTTMLNLKNNTSKKIQTTERSTKSNRINWNNLFGFFLAFCTAPERIEIALTLYNSWHIRIQNWIEKFSTLYQKLQASGDSMQAANQPTMRISNKLDNPVTMQNITAIFVSFAFCLCIHVDFIEATFVCRFCAELKGNNKKEILTHNMA